MNTEPALIIGAVQAVVALAVAFGAPINDTQAKAIMGVASAVLAVLGAVVVRSRVSPAGKQ